MVYLDANKNGVLDFLDFDSDGLQGEQEPDEPWAVTGLNGVWSLDFSKVFDTDDDGLLGTGEGQLIMQGGIDEKTGLPLGFALTAPVGSQIISPLTTLVNSLVNDLGLSVADADAQVRNAFGIVADVQLIAFDPMAGVFSGDAAQASVFSAGSRVRDLTIQVANLFAGVPNTPPLAHVASLLFTELATRTVASASTIDLSQAGFVAALIHSMQSRLGVTLGSELIEGAARIIAEGDAHLQQIPYSGDIAYLESVAKAQIVAQRSVAEALALAAAGTTSINEAIIANTGANLASQIQAAQAGNVVPPAVYIDDVTVLESSDGAETIVSFTVRLNVPSNAPVSLDFETIDGTATVDDGDYIGASGQLTWESGDISSRTIDVHVQGDVTFESDETFSVLLSGIDGAIAWKDFGTATIVNDDAFVYAAPADGGPHALHLAVDGDEIELSLNDELVLLTSLSSATPLTILGAPGVANSLIVELLGPVTGLLGGLTFVGGSQHLDALSILDGAARNLAHTKVGAAAGSIDIEEARINYLSVALASDDLAPEILGLPSEATEGAELSLSAQMNAEGITYHWQVHKDDAPYAVHTGIDFTFIPDDNGTYVATLEATDEYGTTRSTVSSIQVQNGNPTATPNVAIAVLAGEIFSVGLNDSIDASGADTSAGFRYSFAMSPQELAVDFDTASVASSQQYSFLEGGSYTIYSRILDKDGGSTTYSTPVTVINAPSAPVVVEQIQVNDGSDQRSMVNSLRIAFSGLVSFVGNPADAFVLRRAEGGAVTFNVSTSDVDGRTVALLTFTGSSATGGSLSDGRYSLEILSDRILDADGQQLDGDRDGQAGGHAIDELFRLFGDTDGDADVDLTDLAFIRNNMGTLEGETDYLWYLDYGSNGVVDSSDYAQGRIRNGFNV